MISGDMIASARAVPIERVIDERGIKLRGRVERVGPCPVCGGTDRFSVNTKKQVFNCRGCAVGGDVIALVQHLDGCSFIDAYQALRGELPRNGSRKPDPERDKQLRQQRREAETRDEQQRLIRAAHVWNEAQPIAGTPGQTYLAGRGVDLDEVPDHGGLRWHPACPWESGTTPCVIARFTDAVTGEPKGIHRRPLITNTKPKTLGPTAGCVIRLWPDEDVTGGLVIGEGVETTLAAATRIVHRGTLLRPAWAAGSTSNLKKFPMLAGIECPTILVDNDANGAGQNAAADCACRWREAGRKVIRLMPEKLGADFNDLVKP
jgi:phage/plasmid primase-like uncharacterized protein